MQSEFPQSQFHRQKKPKTRGNEILAAIHFAWSLPRLLTFKGIRCFLQTPHGKTTRVLWTNQD